jgi:hypothetical protein
MPLPPPLLVLVLTSLIFPLLPPPPPQQQQHRFLVRWRPLWRQRAAGEILRAECGRKSAFASDEKDWIY